MSRNLPPYDVERGDVVYWGTRSKGIVQSRHGHYANVKSNPDGRVQCLDIKKLRKTQ